LPTFDKLNRFLRDYERLNEQERLQLREALHRFVEDLLVWEAAGCLGLPAFRGELRVKKVSGFDGIWEMTWSYHDGRATFMYGRPVRAGKVHIVWRRVGTHTIFDEP
jgi:hypothetical protein